MRTNELVSLLAVAFLLGGMSFVFAGEEANGLSMAKPSVVLAPTKGKVKATAAINTDGTVASCSKCNPVNTLRLNIGQYQVDFAPKFPNVAAVNGFSRWVQPDTLGGGQFTRFCTTADRETVPSAVFVQCTDQTGAFVDTSFYLFLAR